MEHEYYVSAKVGAEFLGISQTFITRLARKNQIPAHPLPTGSNLRRTWRFRLRAGLPAFRHSLATVLIVDEKVDPKTTQGILRHANSSMTMDVYTHSQDSAKRAALERFEIALGAMKHR